MALTMADFGSEKSPIGHGFGARVSMGGGIWAGLRFSLCYNAFQPLPRPGEQFPSKYGFSRKRNRDEGDL